MNEKETPFTKTVLVERSVPKDAPMGTPRAVEEWFLSDKKDERGHSIAYSRVPLNEQEEASIPHKAVSELALNPEVQARLAERLGQSRDVGREAIGVVMLPSEGIDTHNAESVMAAEADSAVQPVETPSISSPNVVSLDLSSSDVYKDASEKGEKDPVLSRVFAPLERPQDPVDSIVNKNYDYLFASDDVNEAEVAKYKAQDEKDRPIREAQAEYDSFVTDETRALAAEQLDRTLKRDRELQDILLKYSQFTPSLETVDALRTNKDLRYDVGTHLLNKLDMLASMHPELFGNRILNNTMKNNNFNKMTPSNITTRQYATTLALAMIDGSFNGDKQASDDVTMYNEQGKIIYGQHRDAARTILQ